LRADNGTTTNYTGDGYSGIYIWGAQLESSSFSTSYIKTVASQVTRSADSASMVGSNFSSWYRADEGTLYVESIKNGNLNFQQLINVNDGTTSNTIAFGFGSGAFPLRQDVVVSTVSQASITAIADTTALGLKLKISGAYKVNDFAISGNAGAVATDISGVIPNGLNRMDIGYRSASTALTYTGTIKKIAFYPQRLSNAQHQALTA
jgi:hypothetical protein